MAHARFKCLHPRRLQKGVRSQQDSKATTRKASDSVMWNKMTKFTSLSSICLMQLIYTIVNKIKPAHRSPSAGQRTGLFWGTHLLNQSRRLIISCCLFDHSSPRLGGPCGSLRHHGPLWGCKIKSVLVPPGTSFFLPWTSYSPSKHAWACKIPSFLTPCDITIFGDFWHMLAPILAIFSFRDDCSSCSSLITGCYRMRHSLEPASLKQGPKHQNFIHWF